MNDSDEITIDEIARSIVWPNAYSVELNHLQIACKLQQPDNELKNQVKSFVNKCLWDTQKTIETMYSTFSKTEQLNLLLKSIDQWDVNLISDNKIIKEPSNIKVVFPLIMKHIINEIKLKSAKERITIIPEVIKDFSRNLKRIELYTSDIIELFEGIDKNSHLAILKEINQDTSLDNNVFKKWDMLALQCYVEKYYDKKNSIGVVEFNEIFSPLPKNVDSCWFNLNYIYNEGYENSYGIAHHPLIWTIFSRLKPEAHAIAVIDLLTRNPSDENWKKFDIMLDDNMIANMLLNKINGEFLDLSSELQKQSFRNIKYLLHYVATLVVVSPKSESVNRIFNQIINLDYSKLYYNKNDFSMKIDLVELNHVKKQITLSLKGLVGNQETAQLNVNQQIVQLNKELGFDKTTSIEPKEDLEISR